MLAHGASSLLVTQKDAVKMKAFTLPLSLMKLKLELNDALFIEVDRYIKNFKK
jgi:tetraacyldisaccharide 4'-kinase